MIAKRELTKVFKRFAKFPVIVLLGPRQSGKTTLVRETFSKHTYVTLEDPEILNFVLTDPKRFLRQYENKYGIIFEEFQHAPQLLSYLQIEVDTYDRPGYFVLTGSQNFLMNEAVTQTLAGRAAILHLLPLSLHELKKNKLLPKTLDKTILEGGYPRIVAKNFLPQEVFPSYIRTYIERDVRQLVNVHNLSTFQRFMKLCAGRVGQQLVIEDLRTQCGIDRKTAERWLSLLEASYIIFLLQPYYNNFNKRVTKSPKLYFYDTGLACALLGIRTEQELSMSTFRGPLMECLIISDLYKQFYNEGLEPALYYWRDQNGRLEIDCLADIGLQRIPLEIKSGETIVPDFFKNIKIWSEFAQQDPARGYIIYGGHGAQLRGAGNIIGWQAAGNILQKIEESEK